MDLAPELLLIGAVALVGILHTIVPDHWGPIALLAREEKWPTRKVVTTALGAGTGHVLSTLLIGLIMWYAGVEVARHYGAWVSRLSSLGLILFGGWMALSALRELRGTQEPGSGAHPAPHQHAHRSRATALVLVLGSSPMIEGLPAFFAAGRYGTWLIVIMALVFALSTMATYVVMCVYSTQGLRRFRLVVLERYGEVLSGAFILLLGFVFLIWPLA